eukprot:SAG22_NODE_21630_length_255_cov_0.980769_1_plen_84_part_11
MLVVQKLRLVLRPDGGELAVLGVGTAMVSAASLATLDKQRRLFRGMALMTLVSCLALLAAMIVMLAMYWKRYRFEIFKYLGAGF